MRTIKEQLSPESETYKRILEIEEFSEKVFWETKWWLHIPEQESNWYTNYIEGRNLI